MNFTKLITRNQYEKIARANGVKGAHTLPYKELERLATEIVAQRRATYRASQREAR